MGRYEKQLRIGLQFKAILILTAVVLAATLAGNWFYYKNAEATLRENDLRHVTRLGHSLAVESQYYLRDRQRVALQRLADDFLTNESVSFVAILDSEGRVVAKASRAGRGNEWPALVNLALPISSTYQLSDNILIVARPVLLGEALFWKDHMVGAVRVVFDVSSTTASLKRVRERMVVVAAGIILCVIPVAYLAIWRIVVQPFRRLLRVTRRLTKGDFSARTGFKRNDEVGELAFSFDMMASEIARMRSELIRINEGLEEEVSERTEEIQRANLRLREEMSEKEDFLRAVSHDLNAPLRNIAGMTTMIQMKWRQDLPDEVL